MGFGGFGLGLGLEVPVGVGVGAAEVEAGAALAEPAGVGLTDAPVGLDPAGAGAGAVQPLTTSAIATTAARVLIHRVLLTTTRPPRAQLRVIASTSCLVLVSRPLNSHRKGEGRRATGD